MARIQPLLMGGIAAALATLALATPAHATPTQKCGGQGALRRAITAPSVCYNDKVVGGLRVRVDVVVNPDRTFAVTFSLPNGPVDQIVGLQIKAHPHLSGDPGTVARFDTLPAGQVSFPLGGQFPAGNLCDPHQLDIKAWPGHPGDAKHWSSNLRISGATFVFATAATGCGVTTTTPPTVPTPSTVPVQTTVPSSVPVPTTLGVPTTPPAHVAGCTLDVNGIYVNDVTGQPCSTPATGAPNDSLALAGIALMMGSLGALALIGLLIYREVVARRVRA